MKTKKLVAIFLTAVMAASAMNVTAFAGQASDSTESLNNCASHSRYFQ